MKNILKKITVITACIATVATMQVSAMHKSGVALPEHYACRCLKEMLHNGSNPVATVDRYKRQTQVINSPELSKALDELAQALAQAGSDQAQRYNIFSRYAKRLEKLQQHTDFADYYAIIKREEAKLAPEGRRQRQAAGQAEQAHLAAEGKRAAARQRSREARRGQ